MAKRRVRRFHKNPSGTAWLLIALGATAVGVGAYLYFRKGSSTTPSTPAKPGGTTPAIPSGGGATPALITLASTPGLPAMTPEMKAQADQIIAAVQKMAGVSQDCKDKMIASTPIALQIDQLEQSCASAPTGNALCSQLPSLKAQLQAIQDDFTKNCPPPTT